MIWLSKIVVVLLFNLQKPGFGAIMAIPGHCAFETHGRHRALVLYGSSKLKEFSWHGSHLIYEDSFGNINFTFWFYY